MNQIFHDTNLPFFTWILVHPDGSQNATFQNAPEYD